MAWHRLEHARSRVNELERIKNKHLQGRALLRPQPQQMNQNQQNGLQGVGNAQGAGTTG
jgi:mediator of RNA polymerase II transcription subunit 11